MYDRRDGMQGATRKNEPARKPAVAPGKRTLTQGLSRGLPRGPIRAPALAPRIPTPEERAADEAARQEQDAETQRWIDIAMRPDLYLASLKPRLARRRASLRRQASRAAVARCRISTEFRVHLDITT